MEAEEDKENRPPEAASSFPWDSDSLMVQRMAEKAEQRKRQRIGSHMVDSVAIAVRRCSGMAVQASVEREATRVFGAEAA